VKQGGDYSVAALMRSSAALESSSPRLDVELLLCRASGRSRTWLRTWPDHRLTPEQHAEFRRLLERRAQGEPMAYLLGEREFWSLRLRVAPGALIPRPDTETLVAAALALPLGPGCRVLDLGAGTGAIALALASERPAWRVHAVDIDEHCAALTRENAAAHGLDNVDCWRSDWYAAVAGRYHLIVSNPPYIAADDPHLDVGDLRFEPRRALVAADAGLADLRHIAAQASDHLEAGGWLLLEHGYQQADACAAALRQAGFDQVSCIRDVGGCERVTLGCWPGAMSADAGVALVAE